MSSDAPKPFFQVTDLALIDDPLLPAREQMDEAKMEELVSSIRDNGLLQPVGLKPTADRYEVIYGHRRTMACRLVPLPRVPSMVYPEGSVSPEAAKLHENTKREDLNPGEEAVWFAELLETLAGGDTDKLATLVNESRDYVEKRLNLLRGDEYVLVELKAGRITFAVAQALNRVKGVGERRAFLDAALRGGATARLVDQWRKMQEVINDANPHGPAPATDPAHFDGTVRRSPMYCLLCDGEHDLHMLLQVFLHPYCLQFLERQMGVSLRGLYSQPPSAIEPPAPGPTDAQ